MRGVNCIGTCSRGTASILLMIILQRAAHRLSITLRSDSLVSMLENTDSIIGKSLGTHFVKETPLKVIITQLTPNRRASGCKGYVTTMGPAAWARHPSPNTLLLRTSASLSLTPATSTGSRRLDSRPPPPLPQIRPQGTPGFPQ